MKKILLSVLINTCAASIFAQVVSTQPVVPVHNRAVTITFDAGKGTAGLKDYAGTVYAHTGVITSKSSGSGDWKYANKTWGENLPKHQLTSKGNNLWELTLTPDLRAWYGVPDDEVILKMAFVFRSGEPKTAGGADFIEGKDEGGKDIFIDVSEDDFNIAITAPRGNSLFEEGDNVALAAASSAAATLRLYSNGVEVKRVDNDSLIAHTLAAVGSGNYTVVATAASGAKTKADTVRFVVRGETQAAALPPGVREGISYYAADHTKATLVLRAPGKSFVYAVGDFNNWALDNRYLMKKDGDRFWITLSGLTPNREYRFQYAVDGAIYVGDPYAEKVLDPWNDPWIPAAVYPDLTPYPEGKADGYVSVLQTAQPPYEWQVKNFTPPAKTDLVIYELLMRDFLKQHDYATLIDTLPYLQRLGVNAIELLPFGEFDGNESWGYNPAYFCAPDKAYGNPKMLKRFIDECHRRGIAVIMDIVLNHAFGNSPTVKMWWDAAANLPAHDNPYHNRIAKHPYNVGEDFNHESPHTQHFVGRVVEHWLKEYNIDGYRFDLSKGFTQNDSQGDIGRWTEYDGSRVAHLKRISQQVWAAKPNAYVILEHLGSYHEEVELCDNGMMLWSNQQPAYANLAMGWAANLQNVQNSAHGFGAPHLVPYMESHDEERIMYDLLHYGNEYGGYSARANALERVAMAAVMFYTVPGPKMLWQFGELGYDYSIGQCADTVYVDDGKGGKFPTMIHNEWCRTDSKPIRWDYAADEGRKKLFGVFAKLIHLKKTYPAIRQPNSFYIGAVGGNDNDLRKWIFAEKGDSSLLAVVNADVVQQTFDVYFPNTGAYHELFSGEELNVTSTQWQFTLKPGEYRIYTRTKIGEPQPPSAKPQLVELTLTPDIGTAKTTDGVTLSLSAPGADSVMLTYNSLQLVRKAGSAAQYSIQRFGTAGVHRFTAQAKFGGNVFSASREVNVTADPLPPTTTAADKELAGAIRIYPNPVVNGELKIENGEWGSGTFSTFNSQLSIEIYNLSGTLVMQRVLPQAQGVVSINMAALSSGVYLVRVSTASGSTATRQIVKK